MKWLLAAVWAVALSGLIYAIGWLDGNCGGFLTVGCF